MSLLLHTFWDTGLRLLCPVCEQGKLFRDWFNMHALCPHCHVRFERYEGEMVGGMTISSVVTSALFLIGYVSIELHTEWPVWLHLAIWVPFACLFPVLFYRHSRALWVACLHLSGDVHWDREPYEEPRYSIMDAFRNNDPDPPSADPPAPSSSDDVPPPHEQTIP